MNPPQERSRNFQFQICPKGVVRVQDLAIVASAGKNLAGMDEAATQIVERAWHSG